MKHGELRKYRVWFRSSVYTYGKQLVEVEAATAARAKLKVEANGCKVSKAVLVNK